MAGKATYKEAFLSEAREHLDYLNEGILNLEKDPENVEYINQVFRACHTLKGNSSMMGFSKFSDLAHKMENVLGKIREKQLSVEPDTINLLLEGSDLLEIGLDQIASSETDNIETDHLLDELEMLAHSKTVKDNQHFKLESRARLTPEQEKAVAQQTELGRSVFRIVVLFNPENKLKGAKSQIILKKAETLIEEMIYTNPSLEMIKAGKIDTGFEIVFSSAAAKEELEDVFSAVSDIDSYVLSLDDTFDVTSSLLSSTLTQNGNSRDQADKKDVIEKTLTRPIQSVKIDVKKLDNLVNMVGELLISNMRLAQIAKEIESSALDEVINNINMLTSSIQEEVMQQRMVPCGQIFSRFPRLIRDISTKENKKIEFNIQGEDIELDRNVLDEIGEPLIHILRNAVDHGIEEREIRINSGKSELGRIELIARREKNMAVIEIKDDGGGIDLQKVVDASVRKGVITDVESQDLDPQKALMLIFKPGVSTNQKVTDISGRGVGMDVVLTKIKKLGGNVKVESDLGKGTRIELHLPLTLAIIASLLVKIQNYKYAIPLSSVKETIDLPHDDIKKIHHNEVIVLRGEEVPIVRLDEFFSLERSNRSVYPVVIIEEQDKKVGIIVDEIINQQPILIKNLHQLIRGVKGIAGGTILGDGKVCLILDPSSVN